MEPQADAIHANDFFLQANEIQFNLINGNFKDGKSVLNN